VGPSASNGSRGLCLLSVSARLDAYPREPYAKYEALPRGCFPPESSARNSPLRLLREIRPRPPEAAGPHCREDIPKVQLSSRPRTGGRLEIRRGLLYMLLAVVIQYFAAGYSPLTLPIQVPALVTAYRPSSFS